MKKAAREEPLSFQYRRQANKNEVLLFLYTDVVSFFFLFNTDVVSLFIF